MGESKQEAAPKRTVSVSIEQENYDWLASKLAALDCRSFSHGIDRAISAFRKEIEGSGKTKAKRGSSR
jgi:hypothetical protein